MSIEIKNPETERVVRELARRLNVEPDEAVRRVGEAALADIPDDSGPGPVDEAEVDRILAWFDQQPIVDDRPIDELMADDEPR